MSGEVRLETEVCNSSASGRLELGRTPIGEHPGGPPSSRVRSPRTAPLAGAGHDGWPRLRGWRPRGCSNHRAAEGWGVDEKGKVPANLEGGAGRGAGGPVLQEGERGHRADRPGPPAPPTAAGPWRPRGSWWPAPPSSRSEGCTGGCGGCPRRNWPLGTAGSGGTSASPWRTACSRGPGRCSGAGLGVRGALGEGEGWEAAAGDPVGVSRAETGVGARTERAQRERGQGLERLTMPLPSPSIPQPVTVPSDGRRPHPWPPALGPGAGGRVCG